MLPMMGKAGQLGHPHPGMRLSSGHDMPMARSWHPEITGAHPTGAMPGCSTAPRCGWVPGGSLPSLCMPKSELPSKRSIRVVHPVL